MSQVAVAPKLMQLAPAWTDQDAVEQREDQLEQKASYAWQRRRNANMLIGGDPVATDGINLSITIRRIALTHRRQNAECQVKAKKLRQSRLASGR